MSRLNLTMGAWAALIAGVVFGINSNVVKVANNIGLTIRDLLIYQFGFGAGISFSASLFSLQKITDHPFTKVFIFLIATIIAFVFCLGRYGELKLFTIEALKFGFIIAISGQIVSFELPFYADNNVSSVTMATLTTTELPVVMILTWFIWGPLPNFVRVLGLAVLVIAVFWLTIEQSQLVTHSSFQQES